MNDVPARDRALWGVVAVGAVLRLVYWATKFGDPLLLNDSWYYSGQARQLAQGQWFRELFVDRPGAEHGPLTSLLMAPVSHGSHFQDWQRLVTVATGIAMVWVMGRVATVLAGRTAGLVAAGIAAVYPNLWMNDGLVMSESISMLLVASSLWAAWRAAQAAPGRPLQRAVAVLGVLLGLAVLARSELALFVPLVAVWLWWSRREEPHRVLVPVVAIGLAVAVVSPWVVFNLSRFEKPVFLTTNDGTTLLGANCDDTYVGHNIGGWTIGCVEGDPDYAQDEEPSVRSARQRHLGLSYIRHHVGSLPKVMVARVARSLDLYGLEDNVHQDVGEERPRWAVWAGIVMFWALSVLAVLGARGTDRRLRLLLAVPVVVALVTTLLFYGAHRIRSSAEPSLVLFAAMWLAARVRRAPS